VLTLYRRHLTGCEKTGEPCGTAAQEKDKCHCPIWVRGTWDGKPIRKSLDVNRWAKAEKLKREIEDGTRPEEPKEEAITVRAALDAFIAEGKRRNLNHSTLRKYKSLAAHLTRYAEQKRYASLDRLGSEEV
jgi:hypothetical protein